MLGAWDDDTAPRQTVHPPITPSVPMPMPQPWPNYAPYQGPIQQVPTASSSKDVPAHLTELRELFRENSELRHRIDTAINQEFVTREQPLSRKHRFYTVVGVVLGILLGFVLALALHVAH
jgi:hypothetical protein